MINLRQRSCRLARRQSMLCSESEGHSTIDVLAGVTNLRQADLMAVDGCLYRVSVVDREHQAEQDNHERPVRPPKPGRWHRY